MTSPLNPVLYNRLQSELGRVQVSHTGIAANLQYTRDAFGGKAGNLKIQLVTKGEYYRVNCFAPETLVATKYGDMPIKDLVGNVELLIPNHRGTGNWQSVMVSSFGVQPLLTVNLSHKQIKKNIRATPDHRWVVLSHTKHCDWQIKTTKQLCAGDKVARCYGRCIASYHRQINISATGVAQGFIFGDGSKETCGRRPASVVIQTEHKDEALLPFFCNCRQTIEHHGNKALTKICDLPRSWKELPDSNESLSFLLGWFAGYFSADGHVSKTGKQATLYSCNIKNLNFVKGICYQLGIRCNTIIEKHRTNGGCVTNFKDKKLYALSFSVRDVPMEFWIQKHHRFSVIHAAVPSCKHKIHWVVESVVDNHEVDEVFCAVVPYREMFTLADNITTMNCPYCGDSRGRLWVNHLWGVPNEVTGSKNLWLAICYNEDCMSTLGRPAELYDRLFAFKNVGQRNPIAPMVVLPGEVEDTTLREVPLPGYVMRLDKLPPLDETCVYLRGRGLDPVELGQLYDASYCLDADVNYPQAQGRIVIPIIMRGKRVGWQCRYPKDIDFKLSKIPKYYNRPLMARRLMLYNFDNAIKFPYVVVCEGVTDVWGVGPQAVAAFGKHLSQTQVQMICENWRNGAVIILLDGDAWDDALELEQCFQTCAYPGAIIPVRLPPDKDPGDLDCTFIWNCIGDEAAKRGIDLVAMKRDDNVDSKAGRGRPRWVTGPDNESGWDVGGRGEVSTYSFDSPKDATVGTRLSEESAVPCG